MILLLAQNGFKVKHFLLGSKSDNVLKLNFYYTKYELSSNSLKRLNQLLEDSDVIVINDLENFEKFSNLDSISQNSKKPLIMNQKFEVFMPDLNCFYSIFNDKQMLSFSGILSSSRPFREYVPPFIPKVNIFVKLF